MERQEKRAGALNLRQWGIGWGAALLAYLLLQLLLALLVDREILWMESLPAVQGAAAGAAVLLGTLLAGRGQGSGFLCIGLLAGRALLSGFGLRGRSGST